MIFVLSCFDLAVVTIAHPLITFSAISTYLDGYSDRREKIRIFVNMVLHGFSMFSLLTLNIERFLALMCPFFHQTHVNKCKLMLFLCFLMSLFAGMMLLSFAVEQQTNNIIATVYLSILTILFACLNYKMYVIAKTKKRNATLSINSNEELRDSLTSKNRSRVGGLRNVSTCSMAVVCYLACSSPALLYCFICFSRKIPLHDKNVSSFSLWAGTSVTLNSTFNAVIFFWRNTILRQEGMKLLKRFR